MTGVFVLIIVVGVTKRFTALQEKQARVFAECRKTFYIITNLNKLECLSFTCVINHCQCHKILNIITRLIKLDCLKNVIKHFTSLQVKVSAPVFVLHK